MKVYVSWFSYGRSSIRKNTVGAYHSLHDLKDFWIMNDAYIISSWSSNNRSQFLYSMVQRYVRSFIFKNLLYDHSKCPDFA